MVKPNLIQTVNISWQGVTQFNFNNFSWREIKLEHINLSLHFWVGAMEAIADKINQNQNTIKIYKMSNWRTLC